MALDLEEMAERLRVSLANETKESLTTWLEEQRAKEYNESEQRLIGDKIDFIKADEKSYDAAKLDFSLDDEMGHFDAGYADFMKHFAAALSFRNEVIALPYKKIKLRLPRKVKKWIKKNSNYKIEVFDRELMVAFCKPKYL
jgi:hypothetical protein